LNNSSLIWWVIFFLCILQNKLKYYGL
jgi:hypothetical protein